MTGEKYWAVIPAAGLGVRMGTEVPKQYLPLCGKTVIEHSLARFWQYPLISGVVVALAAIDEHWHKLRFQKGTRLLVTRGGAKRCHSVLAALKRLEKLAQPHDWILVHDAARPCLRSTDIDSLIERLSQHPVGGLLALPVRDTMKRSDKDRTVSQTVPREGLWHALTPQMFRYATLIAALEGALDKGVMVTDEAQAMELAGAEPLLVEGHSDNIKITHRQDLALAEWYLRQQRDEAP